MARDNNALSNAFSQFETGAEVEDQKQEQSTNASTEQIEEQARQQSQSPTVKDVSNELLSMYEAKKKKKTVEETHVRTTFLFDKELEKRLTKLAKGKRGFKTMFFNKAIESLLNEMEGK